ncbi:MAG: hypothetical protein ACQGVK_14360 [Myxococcota bacterium]
MAVVPFSLSAEDVAARDCLDRFRRALRGWSASLFDAESGGFRQSDDVGVNPLATSDMVWLRYAVGESELGAPDPERVAAYLRGAQDPESGVVRHARGPGGQAHSDGHAFWQVTRALRLLGSDLEGAPGAFAALSTPEGLSAWFAARDWSAGGDGNHHEVLGLVPLVASLADPRLSDALLRELAAQQDPESGTWPRGAAHPNISRTFAYTAIFAAAGRLPGLAPRIVDAVLDHQRPNGFWDLERPHFHTMDAAYLLARVPPRVSHREADAAQALRRLGEATRAALLRDQDAYASNPHAVLALAHTLGILQEAFPDEFRSTPRYRFDWDVLAQYASPTLARGARASS